MRALSKRPGPLKRTLVLVDQLGVPLVGAWLVLGWALSRLSTRVLDWYVMTDELLYERLALSVVHLHSPLPRVHGDLIPNVNQLYPILLAGVYGHGLVPVALHDAHLLNAFLMSSAAIPAFLLARRASASRPIAYLVGLGSVCVPWIVYSSFLLTEVVGYPAFLWAVLAVQAAIVVPSRRHDLIALGGLALAIFARTQFVVLVLVLPVALLLYELAVADSAPPARRLRRAAGETVARHRSLAVAYALLGACGVALLAVGHVAAVLGTYADTLEGNLLPSGIGRSLLAHLAVLALSVAVLPFLIGGGWLAATALRPARSERYAFCLTALVTVTALLLEVTVFDLRFGGGVVRDRYLFYVVPLVLIACACGLQAGEWSRRWLILPALLAIAGFLVAELPVFGVLDVDTPVSDLDGYLRSSVHSLEAARLTLAAGTALLTALYLRTSSLVPRRVLNAIVVLALAAAFPAETWYAYATLFGHPGTSGRPLTVQQGGVFDWVDQLVGRNPDVTMLPYPFVPGDYQASRAYWWDLEFWNESVGKAALFPGEFDGTPSTFPPLALHFNPDTGYANISPSRYLVQLVDDSRFRMDGAIVLTNRGAYLIDTSGGPWRADWLTLGLYDDGWTRPGLPGRLRVFPIPNQSVPLVRSVAITFDSPVAGRPVELISNAGVWRGRISKAGTLATVTLCGPAHGFTDVRILVDGSSPVGYGDMRNINTFGSYRTGGVFVSNIGIYLAPGDATCTLRR
jgi:hypothetical protein